jgi:hypothetical protein
MLYVPHIYFSQPREKFVVPSGAHRLKMFNTSSLRMVGFEALVHELIARFCDL